MSSVLPAGEPIVPSRISMRPPSATATERVVAVGGGSKTGVWPRAAVTATNAMPTCHKVPRRGLIRKVRAVGGCGNADFEVAAVAISTCRQKIEFGLTVSAEALFCES